MKLLDYEIAHINMLRNSLAECMVLLKSNGDFPLEKPCRLALYGSGARHTIKGGTGSGEVNSRYFVTVEEGLRQAGFTLTTDKWLDAYDRIYMDAEAQFMREIKKRARKKHTLAIFEGMGAVMSEPEYELSLEGEGHAAVYVLARISGEGNDRAPIKGDIKLTETEIRDILTLQKKYEKFMLVLNVGGPIDLSSVMEVENVLVLSQLGVETGSALAEVLLGKQNPSGKLTSTWSKWEDYCQIGEFGKEDDTRYEEGIYVGYRYFDTVGKKADFPFGYGVSYTTFAYHAVGAALEKDTLKVQVRVTNAGTKSGKEVLQLYVSCPMGRLDKPYKQLAAFAKTKVLEPGETAELMLSCNMTDCASYNVSRACYMLEKGPYIFMAGNSSVCTEVCAVVNLPEDIVTRKLKNCCGKPDFTDWKPQNPACISIESIAKDCPRFTLKAEDIFCKIEKYDKKYEITSFVGSLSDEQLAYMNVGAFQHKGGITSVIGNASTTVAGAAGESASILKEQGVSAIVMADGPAGLRLARNYFVDEAGEHTIGEAIPETIAKFLPSAARWLLKLADVKPKKGQEILHYYTTALPIGTAIAQSWNLEFAERCGDIVGDEMERTGVHLWLAPALNIHRNIRCGRNFEYYSEDPVVSGKVAAAVTNGVQKHRGCGVTIKHFAANNQETNRYNNNSLVSERALREIYLKGFEICIKESAPKSVMTSYNLINGVHTAESRDLVEKILRNEFGFDGIVMTDWTIAGGVLSKNAKYPPADSGMTAAAGVDIIMPGSKSDVDQILDKLKSGELDRDRLRQNVNRMIKLAHKLYKDSEK